MLDVAIVGAGPYGLSMGAYFCHRGLKFRIFGRPMDSWLTHMPKGMMLKSDGFASNLFDPESKYTLRQFCAERGIEYADTGIPVRLDTFNAYGLAFQERMVPGLEDKIVSAVERTPEGFLLRLEDGETVRSRRVVLAVGITNFRYVPPSLADLPPEILTHSADHRDLERFKGRSVAVIGGGSSALDLAGLLHDAGVDVQLISRRCELKFHSQPTGKPRSGWQKIRHPQSGLGPGLRSRFFADVPLAFHYLPESLRLRVVRKALGPSGGWFIRDKVIDRVPTMLGYSPRHAEVLNGKARLQLRADDGGEREIAADQIIAATGYKANLERLNYLSETIRSTVKTINGAPILSSTFESSMPGLYFVGIAAATSFGPVMRFAFGAGFAAKQLTAAVAKSVARERASIPAGNSAERPGVNGQRATDGNALE